MRVRVRVSLTLTLTLTLTKFLVRLLVGGAGGADDGAMALQPAEDTIHSGAAGSSTLPLVERSLVSPEEP